MILRDTAKSMLWGTTIADTRLVQAEITAVVMLWVIDQDQMRRRISCSQSSEIIVGEYIGIDDDKALAQKRQGLLDTTCGLERLHFFAVLDADTELRTIAKSRPDLLTEPAQIDHHIGKTGTRQGLEVVDDQRFTAHFKQRFGRNYQSTAADVHHGQRPKSWLSSPLSLGPISAQRADARGQIQLIEQCTKSRR